MAEINYHIEIEGAFLRIRLEEKSQKPLFQQALLTGIDPAHRAALECLIKEELLFLKMPLTSRQVDTISFNRVRVAPTRSLQVIRLLSLTRKLYWNGQKVLFDPFSEVTFFCEVEPLADQTIRLTGKWKSGEKEGLLSECAFLFPSDPPWFIKNGILQVFSGEIDWKWYAAVYLEPKIVSRSEYTKWIEGKSSFTPHLRILKEIPKSESAPISSLPYLVLKDRTGAFADLWFDYGERGKIASYDHQMTASRDFPQEKGWEKDLLETDFIKKMVGDSHYYCPLDKVAKSLTFLLEIGWMIYDHRGRRVVREKKTEIQLETHKECIYVKGQVFYEDHTANLTDLVGAFNRREQFLQLDPQTVGLIDRSSCEKQFGEIACEEIVTQGIVLKKHQIGQIGDLINQTGISLDAPLTNWAERLKGELTFQEAPPSPLFHGTLLPYQQAGVDWLHFLHSWGLSGLLADEMGLGKTVQLLAFFSRLTHATPSLIVVPTSLIFNWQREIEKFLPSISPYIHSGKQRLDLKQALEQERVIITSYAILRQDVTLLQSVDYACIVLDEGQYIKNSDSQIANAAFSLKAEMRIIISGTPIENRWEDLWSLFRFLIPSLLGERKEFNAKMLAASSDARYLTQTKLKVGPFVLRRKKEEVARQLPEKLSQVIWVEMEEAQRFLYESWVEKNKKGLLKKLEVEGVTAHRMEILEAILRLRQMCGHPWLVDRSIPGDLVPLSGKLQRLLADLDEVIAEKGKVLIYSQFTKMLRLIEGEVKNRPCRYVYLDGSTKDRESVVRQFQEDPDTQVFLISLKAGGVGLNLIAADYVFLYDPWWNEAAENQAIDRAHRFGREKTVIARRYITAFTIEEKLQRLKEYKSALSEGILQGDTDFKQLTLEDLKELLS